MQCGHLHLFCEWISMLSKMFSAIFYLQSSLCNRQQFSFSFKSKLPWEWHRLQSKSVSITISRSINFINKWHKMAQLQNKVLFSALVLCCLVALSMCLPRPDPLGKSHIRATHVSPYGDKKRNQIVWPNSYYDIPRHRYPYYDAQGKGELLYGFGGPSLYKYTVFKPEEGYFK